MNTKKERNKLAAAAVNKGAVLKMLFNVTSLPARYTITLYEEVLCLARSVIVHMAVIPQQNTW